jgi:ABC-2 type transport system permease protein
MAINNMPLNLVSEQAPGVAAFRPPERDAIDRDTGRASAPLAIDARGICKRFGDRDVLSDVSLLVRPGCLHGLLGPNGAGKTTLMRVMLGLIEADAGSVCLLGSPVRVTTDPLAEGVAGYVETPGFYPYLSGRRNLSLVARLDGSPSSDRQARIERALVQVGLTTQADIAVSGYSAGMRQRLGLAAALVRAPRVLLLDEPTSSLDPAAARGVRTLIRDLADQGVAVVLSSHDMAEVEELCEQLTVIDRGRVVYSGSVEALRLRAPAALHILHSSDDHAAYDLGVARRGLKVRPSGEAEGGLEVAGNAVVLDAYTIALGQARLAIRSLERRTRSLESLFLELVNGRSEIAPVPSAVEAPVAPSPARNLALSVGGVSSVIAVECSKLLAQLKAQLALAICVIAPFAFACAMRVQSSLPTDTLFGRAANESGFAVSLVVLGFAGLWAFPVITGIVGGDLFSSEDRYGTWATVLTRSRSRAEVFVGKAVTALVFSVLAIALLAASSIAAGVLFIGYNPVVDLSGVLLQPDAALPRVALAWTSVLPPALGFTALAILVSVATRSSAAGIGLPVVIGLVMQLVAFIDGPDAARRSLITYAFGGWHGLLSAPQFHGPLIHGTAVSVIYFIVCLTIAYRLLERRQITR